MIDTGYRPTGADVDGIATTDDGDGWDLVAEAREDAAPRIEPGQYQARCVHCTTDVQWKTRRLILTFELVQCQAAGTRLKFICEFPHKFKTHSAYGRAWAVANGAPFKRRDRTTPRVFRNRLFLVNVSDTTEDSHQRKLARPYSRIDTILDRLA